MAQYQVMNLSQPLKSKEAKIGIEQNKQKTAGLGDEETIVI